MANVEPDFIPKAINEITHLVELNEQVENGMQKLEKVADYMFKIWEGNVGEEEANRALEAFDQAEPIATFINLYEARKNGLFTLTNKESNFVKIYHNLLRAILNSLKRESICEKFLNLGCVERVMADLQSAEFKDARFYRKDESPITQITGEYFTILFNISEAKERWLGEKLRENENNFFETLMTYAISTYDFDCLPI